MKRLLGVTIACLVLALVAVMGTSSRADFSVRPHEVFTGLHATRADFVETEASFDIVAQNVTGGFLGQGTVVVLDTSTSCSLAAICVKKAPAAEPARVIGVLSVGAANNAVVGVAVAGIVPVTVQGSVTVGDLLQVSSTTAGLAERAPSAGQGVFAIALGGGADVVVPATFIKQEVF